MNRNVESHFAKLPHAEINRSIFDRGSTHKTSFNVGQLIPFYWDEVLPGDTFNVQTSFVARLQTLLTPIMDNVYLDTYYFFVPARLCWSHWKEFMGENTDSAWIPAVEYSVPKIESPENGWLTGTIADYMGIPVGVEFDEETGLIPSALPFRAYALICNEWFRDQNVSDPLNIPLGDSNQEGSNGDNYITDVVNGGMPFMVSKYHDYFTSCLPSPQKGQSVGFDLNVTSTVPDNLPIHTGDNIPSTYYPQSAMKYKTLDGGNWSWYSSQSSGNFTHPLSFRGNPQDPTYENIVGSVRTYASTLSDESNFHEMVPANLWADSSGISISGSTEFTINELRLAFQLQKFYEKNARGGSRYRELIKNHFGVTSPDARMMIPEYLGGHRVPIQIHQVTNNAQSEGEFLGELGAMSNTSDVHDDFIKSFTEHGFVIGVCCARYDHSYPQGLDRAWTRENPLDYYWPVFANIGEQPVYKYEIDATIREDEDRKAVFGYQEAWASYRYKPSRVSGEMRPGISNTLAFWHLSDYYSDQPALSDSWIREDPTNVDRVLAVSSDVSNQMFCDFYINNRCTRAMPMYSIPGLIDHH